MMTSFYLQVGPVYGLIIDFGLIRCTRNTQCVLRNGKIMKISIIIPAYNHEEYITEAINSVLNQSVKDYEIIIINDGSTDSTEQRILSIHDKRIQYISQKNSGAHSAINRGINLAQGEYISILNSDDIICRNDWRHVWIF